MPRRDGTGPMGMGSKTGRGMGFCNVSKSANIMGGLGLGLGCRKGFKRSGLSTMNQKDLLMEQKEILKSRLNVIDNQLNMLQDDK
ncbi:DUF5320 domain-containing protein [Inediibacterium massiliense]|uniref:DUF5320 domain-containing protein n=1 Tax=Inediibacterium massiliense TaxID=1658111 RepID=UPI0006B53EC8|nr:DUF5320 domain-containing protein [Inediibacterium massiliense]